MIRIDTHQHFWNLDEVMYPWLGPKFVPLYRTFEADLLEPLLRDLGISQTITVQANNSYEDTAYMLKVSDTTDWIGGVIGWVNLLDPAETDQRLTMYKRHPKFKGLRHLIHDELDENWVLQDRVIESLKVVAQHEVLFEVPDAYPRHLKQVPLIMEHVPALRIIIDHLAKPPIKANQKKQTDEWAAQLKAVASSPVAYAKVSGLNTAADHNTWSALDLQYYVDYALQCFGADRLMWGSDWPVCLMAGDYPRVFHESTAVLDRYSQAERAAIWGETAIKVYALKV